MTTAYSARNRRRTIPIRSNPSTSIVNSDNSGAILAVIVIGIILYFILQQRNGTTAGPGKYNNLESWNVSYNADGLPTKIEIHREATRS